MTKLSPTIPPDLTALRAAYEEAIAATGAARRRFRPGLQFPEGALEAIRLATLREIDAGRRFLAAHIAAEHPGEGEGT